MAVDSHGLAVGPGEGRFMRSPIGGDATILAAGHQTGGALAVLDVVVPPGQGPPLHVHTREDETAYVLEGELRWKLGDEMSQAPAGSFVFIPRDLPRSRRLSERGCRARHGGGRAAAGGVGSGL